VCAAKLNGVGKEKVEAKNGSRVNMRFDNVCGDI
jgi:hypothetical protein